MTRILLRPEVAARLDSFLERMPDLDRTDTDLKSLSSRVLESEQPEAQELRCLLSTCRELLDENGFCHLKGLSPTERVSNSLALGVGLGTVFTDLSLQGSVLIEARPHPRARLHGNRTAALPLHTDFAMLPEPPEVTFIRCQHEDPSGAPFGQNGVALAQEIVSTLYGTEELDLFQTVKLPFAGQGGDGNPILTEAPILEPSGTLHRLSRVRFHPSRVHHGARVRGERLTPEECRVLSAFQLTASRFRRPICLERGDVLLVNNRCVLHDRAACSLQWSAASAHARVVEIMFVTSLHREGQASGV